MYYDKIYSPSSYFDYRNYNELKNKILDLLEEFSEIIDISEYPVEYIISDKNEIDDFFVQYINYLEDCIKRLAFDFYKPTGYINNKIWIEDENTITKKSISYIDINRLITDMNLLYKHKDDTISIYNLYTNEEWNTGVTSLVWRE